jgi:predicted esterase
VKSTRGEAAGAAQERATHGHLRSVRAHGSRGILELDRQHRRPDLEGSPPYDIIRVSTASGDVQCAVPLDSLRVPAKSALVLALHGYGSDEGCSFRALPGLNKRAVVVAPRGLLAVRRSGRAWCSTVFTERGPVDDAEETRRSAALLQQAVPEIARQSGGRTDRLAVFGHSQGGMVALLLACMLDPAPIAVAVVGAQLPPAALDDRAALRGVPVLACHGSDDSVVPADLHAHIGAELESRGACVVDHAYRGGHRMTQACARFVEAWLLRRIEEASSEDHA